MLVEDTEADVYLILESLHQHAIAFDLVRFENGNDAMLYLRADPGRSRTRPDLILLDLHLPGMSGHEILRVLRVEPWLAGVPIVILSGASPKTVGDLSGSARYIQKPMDVNDYLESVGSAVIEVCHPA